MKRAKLEKEKKTYGVNYAYNSKHINVGYPSYFGGVNSIELAIVLSPFVAM
jgi:hypothetical protein